MGGLQELIRRLPSIEKLKNESHFHYALSDANRLRILYALELADHCPCILKRIVAVGDSKLSYHLRILEKEGLIRSKKRKTWRIYSITPRGRRYLEAAADEGRNHSTKIR